MSAWLNLHTFFKNAENKKPPVKEALIKSLISVFSYCCLYLYQQ